MSRFVHELLGSLSARLSSEDLAIIGLRLNRTTAHEVGDVLGLSFM